MSQTINVFVIYAREDKDIKHRLLTHLNPLKKPFKLEIWHDDFIEPGQAWKPEILQRLDRTDLFLFLVSVDFMNSDFIGQVEIKKAFDRYKQDKSIVIPIIIKPCQWDIPLDFDDYPIKLDELEVLPYEAKPIQDWASPEQGYNNAAAGVRRVLQTITETRLEQQKRQQEELEQKRKDEEEIAKRQAELEQQRKLELERQEADEEAKRKRLEAENRAAEELAVRRQTEWMQQSKEEAEASKQQETQEIQQQFPEIPFRNLTVKILFVLAIILLLLLIIIIANTDYYNPDNLLP